MRVHVLLFAATVLALSGVGCDSDDRPASGTDLSTEPGDTATTGVDATTDPGDSSGTTEPADAVTTEPGDAGTTPRDVATTAPSDLATTTPTDTVMPDAGCAAGLIDCAGTCTDTGTDDANCGTCGAACPANEACVGGACQSSMTCPGLGEVACAGVCTDTASDPMNCGMCGNGCPSDQTCLNSTCAGGSVCPGAEYPTCGQVCCAQNAVCNAGSCSCGQNNGDVGCNLELPNVRNALCGNMGGKTCLILCEEGFQDTNGDYIDGCEAMSP